MKDKIRCNKCLLPSTHNLPFDKNGTCKICNSPSLLKHITTDENLEQLSTIINEAKSKARNSKYDCLIGLSGGRDSTYLLIQLVEKHHLRVLAFFGKTIFTPVEITENVKNITDKLGVKLITYDIPGKLHKAVSSFCLKKWKQTQSPIFANLACAPCKFVNREIFRQAAIHKIRTIFYGGNRYEYFPMGPASIDMKSEKRYSFNSMLFDHLIRVKKGMSLVIQNASLIKFLPTLFKASFLYINQYSIYLRVLYPKVKRYDYFHYIRWDEKEVIKTIQEYGWRLPQHCNSTWRADCTFEAIKNTIFSTQVGYSYTEAFYSNVIRAGHMNRGEGLNRLQVEIVSPERVRSALKTIDINPNFFDNL